MITITMVDYSHMIMDGIEYAAWEELNRMNNSPSSIRSVRLNDQGYWLAPGIIDSTFFMERPFIPEARVTSYGTPNKPGTWEKNQFNNTGRADAVSDDEGVIDFKCEPVPTPEADVIRDTQSPEVDEGTVCKGVPSVGAIVPEPLTFIDVETKT